MVTVKVATKVGRRYELQTRPDLGIGTWTTKANAGPFSTEFELPLTDYEAPSDKAFYRVRVTRP